MSNGASPPAGGAPAHWPTMSIAEANARLTAPGARFEIEERLIRGVATKCWKNCPRTLRDVLLAGAAHRDREFIVYEDDRITFDAFARAVAALAREFERRGVRKGDRVALVMRNLPEWPTVFFAASVCGAIVTPLNAWWTHAEIEYGLSNSGAKLAVLDRERYERIAGRLPNCTALEQVYVCREERQIDSHRVAQLETVLGSVSEWARLPQQDLPAVALDADDDATLFYTSGTTGKPKGALGTHRNITTNIFTTGAVQARAQLRRGQTPPDPATLPQRVTLLAVPLFHVTGCNASLVPAVFGGGKLVLMRKWEAEKAMQLIERERVTTTGGVPTIAWQLLEHPARARYDLSSLETISYGGAPSAPELVRRIVEDFPGALPGNGWGMTETSGSFANNTAEDYINRPSSCGPAPAVGAFRVVVDGTRDAYNGETGELWVKGPMVVKGYWNNAEATAATFIDGWLRTGDVARLDDEGFCYIVDRAKDMLIRGGENIYCIEVENVLYEHPAVMDAALVGIPHKTLGEEPAAVVHLVPGAEASETELREWVKQRLAPFKAPVKVAFLSEPLPRNPAGKILKNDLRKLFEA